MYFTLYFTFLYSPPVQRSSSQTSRQSQNVRSETATTRGRQRTKPWNFSIPVIQSSQKKSPSLRTQKKGKVNNVGGLFHVSLNLSKQILWSQNLIDVISE